MTPADDTTPLEPVWLSHHHRCDADRCVRFGGVHVCRRCLAMFAGFFVALALFVVTSFEAQVGDISLVVVMAGYAAYEFVQVVLGRMTYSARRVLVVSPFVGIVLAWLGVTGLRNGLGPAQLVLGAVAAALLALLVVNGSVARRTVTSR
ncbi:MAG: hypothetical protein ACSLFO_06020 [Acidimicrobiales bacterium]